jgi:hypothetical protein
MNSDVLNVRSFGASGLGYPHDDHAAFVAAHDAADKVRGARLVIPNGDYFLSETWNITNPVDIIGDNHGFPLGLPTGPTLIFPPGRHGIITHGSKTYGDGASPPAEYNGHGQCAIANLNIHSMGGKSGPGPAHGLWLRTSSQVLRCQVGHAPENGFSGNGVQVVATVGAGGELEGNANLFRMALCQADHNGINGFYFHGADANAAMILALSAQVNGQVGIKDLSFLGNGHAFHHSSGNGFRAYHIGSPSAYHVVESCYTEGAGNSLFERPTVVIGGTASSRWAIDPASTAYVRNGNMSCAGPFVHQENKGPVQIQVSIGKNDDTLTALEWAHMIGDVYQDFYSLRFDNASKWWTFQGNNYGGYIPFRLPSPVIGQSLRAFAPDFPNGFYIGGPDGIHVGKASSIPGPDEGNVGDFRFADGAAAEEVFGWSKKASGWKPVIIGAQAEV